MEQRTMQVRHTVLWMLCSEISAIYPTYLFVCLLQARHCVGPEPWKAWFLPARSLLRLLEVSATQKWHHQIERVYGEETDGSGKEKLILAEVKMWLVYLKNHLKCFPLQHLLTPIMTMLLFLLWNLKTLSVISLGCLSEATN